MSRNSRQRALPPKKEDEKDDDVIVGEVVNPQLVNQKVIEKFADRDEPEELERFLKTINNFTREQAEIAREHADKHPDAIDHRNNRSFRRLCYSVLLVFAGGLIITMPLVNLVVAGTFGIIAMLIICGVMLNARDRELDLSGFLKMIQTVINRREK